MTADASISVAAVIPVKNLHNAKQRLSSVLSQQERRDFFEAMVEDVLDAVVAARRVSEVFLVTRDPQAKILAARWGASVFEEPCNRGHTEAVEFAAEALTNRGDSAMLTLPGDIPLVRPDEIDELIAAHRPGPAITISPARDEKGSNAVLCTPPGALPFRFGENSFFPHLEKARAVGIDPQVVPKSGIALDVDTPEDLALFASKVSETRAYRFLQSVEIRKRCFSAE